MNLNKISYLDNCDGRVFIWINNQDIEVDSRLNIFSWNDLGDCSKKKLTRLADYFNLKS